MKVLTDTSVLVAGMVESHEKHAVCHEYLRRGRVGDFEWYVATHSLLESYAVLTSLPLSPRMAPGTARRLVRENVEEVAELVDLNSGGYGHVLDELASDGFSGGVVYDGLIASAASRAEVERLVTLNTSDFQRITWLDDVDVLPP